MSVSERISFFNPPPTTGHRIKEPKMPGRINCLLEDKATPADRIAHIDLADWLLRYLETDNK